MRKRMMKKKRSCALCKPHKVGWDIRYKGKDLAKLEEAEKIIESEIKCDARAKADYESCGGSDY